MGLHVWKGLDKVTFSPDLRSLLVTHEHVTRVITNDWIPPSASAAMDLLLSEDPVKNPIYLMILLSTRRQASLVTSLMVQFRVGCAQ